MNRDGTSVLVTVQSYLEDYSTIVGNPVTIDVQFTCEIGSLTASSLTDAEYIIGEAAVSPASFSEFTTGGACPLASISYTWSASPDCSAIVSFNAATRTFTFEGGEADLALAGDPSTTYTVTVTGTSGVQTADTTFDLIVTNPCVDPALITITVPDGSLETYTIGEAVKTVALPTGFSPSTTVCGAVALTVTSSIPAIVYDEGSSSLQIETSDASLDSTVAEVELQAYLEDYPDIVAEPVFIYVEMTVIVVEEEVKPYFVKADLPPEFISEQVKSFAYDTSTASVNTIDFGTLADPEGDDFTVDFTD